jgi:hypothetical protein
MSGGAPNLPRLRFLVLPFVVALLAAPLASPRLWAQQQEGETLVLGRRQKAQWLHLDPAEYTLELVTRYDASQIKQPSSGTAKSSTWTFEESIEAATTGYIVHPNLVELNLAGKFGLAQRIFEGDTLDTATPLAPDTQQNENQNDIIYAWDARATFLRNQIAPLTLYTTRSQQYISREFGPTLETTNTLYGLNWSINLKNAPMRVLATHREEDQDDLAGSQAFSIKQDTFEWGGTYKLGLSRFLSWDYSFNDVSQSGAESGDTHFNNHDASLRYEDEFGPKRQHTFYSTLEYRNQSGDFPLEQLRFDNSLRLQHTDRFETDYTYTYTDDDIAGSQRIAHRGTARFRHRLYESLVTSGQVGAESNEFGGGGTGEIYFANLNFDYTKRIGSRGRLSADLTLATAYQNEEANAQPIVIADEPHTFTDPLGAVIARANINPSSIRVTDAAGIVRFRPGIDYQVVSFANRTELRRIPTGLIPPGGAVLIDYALLPEPAHTTTTNSIAGGVRYDFTEGYLKGLAVYGRFLFQDQNIESGQTDFFIPDDVTDYMVGTEYRVWDFVLTAEHQWHDSEIDPYDSTRLSARYARRFRQNTTLSATAAYTTIDYREPTNTVDLVTVSAELEHHFSRSFDARLTLLYRNERDDLLGDTTGFEQLLDLTWKHRQTEIYVLLRNATFDTDTQDSSFQYFQLGFRRRF